MPFSPFEPSRPEQMRRRFRQIPVRTLLPNLITLLALCAGLTGMRLAVEGKLEWAVAAIVFAALLDGVDGRLARMLKGTSRFGAELDSLADFVNFGVAPAHHPLLLGAAGTRQCRLDRRHGVRDLRRAAARALQRHDRRSRTGRPGRATFFTGMPAPAGAITVLLPIYRLFPVRRGARGAARCLVYTLAIAFLMVSRIPVFSGKRVGKRVAPEMVLPVFVCVVLFFALLVAYPWWVLTIGTLLYLGSLPFGWQSYRDQRAQVGRRQCGDRGRRSSPAGRRDAPALRWHMARPPVDPERPTRLN